MVDFQPCRCGVEEIEAIVLRDGDANVSPLALAGSLVQVNRLDAQLQRQENAEK